MEISRDSGAEWQVGGRGGGCSGRWEGNWTGLVGGEQVCRGSEGPSGMGKNFSRGLEISRLLFSLVFYSSFSFSFFPIFISLCPALLISHFFAFFLSLLPSCFPLFFLMLPLSLSTFLTPFHPHPLFLSYLFLRCY